MVPEVGPTESLGEHVGVLLSRSCVLYRNLASLAKFTNKVETYIDMLASGGAQKISIISAFVPWLSSRASILAPHVSGAMKDKTASTNKASLTSSPAAMYSSFQVDNETTRYVLLAWLTAVPPKVTAIPDTERLSLSLFA